MKASNSSNLFKPVQYGQAWGAMILQRWYTKHPSARELLDELGITLDDSKLINWICDSSQQSRWENYKRGIKYIEFCKPRYLEYFKEDFSLYKRVVLRIFNKDFFEKFTPELLDRMYNQEDY